jgi:hypothetical protein
MTHRRIALHSRYFIVKRPPKQAPDRLDAHIPGFWKVALAITQHADGFRAHPANRKICKCLFRARSDALRPGVFKHLLSYMLRFWIELPEVG